MKEIKKRFSYFSFYRCRSDVAAPPPFEGFGGAGSGPVHATGVRDDGVHVVVVVVRGGCGGGDRDHGAAVVAAGGIRVRRRQRRAHVQPSGAHQVRRRERRDRDARQPAAGRGRGVPRRAVCLTTGRFASVHAAGHRVAVVGRQGGRPVRAGVPATVAQRVQRDGRAQDDGPRPHAVPAPPVAVPAEPERGLPVPEHLRAGTR